MSLRNALEAISKPPTPTAEIEKTRRAIVAFSRGEIGESVLALHLTAAGWSPKMVHVLVASSRKALQRRGQP